MPVARIIAHNSVGQNPTIRELTERLRAEGYEVEFAPPGAAAGNAELVFELQELSAGDALNVALRMAREADADVFIAPGIFAVGPAAEPSVPPAAETRSAAGMESEPARVQDPPLEHPPANSRAGLGESFSDLGGRASNAWQNFQQRRADAAEARRLERETREVEREQRRRAHQVELQRQADEKQRLLAERERLAAERERVVREQMARETAERGERERIERETMAREAARRAELARTAEVERRRLADAEQERLRLLREQEAARAAALALERARLQAEAERRQVVTVGQTAAPLRDPEVVAAESPVAAAAPAHRPRLLKRRTVSARERQWQRAVFIAAVATLAAMIGFAIAANMRPSSPIPSSVIQNRVEQQVPFGPARINLSPGTKAPAVPSKAAAAPRRPIAEKPSAAKAVPTRRVRRSGNPGREIVADDEVTVHHAPASRAQRAQTTSGGVRHFSDDN